MIYPKDIEDWIQEQMPVAELNGLTFRDQINKTARPVWETGFQMELWMLKEGRRISPPVGRLLSFLSEMRDRFMFIQKEMNVPNVYSSHQLGHDAYSAGWAGPGLLPMAYYLYYLHSRGITGSVLESGVFKGGSTCCLSWVCRALGFKLYAADCFDGLPYSEAHYSRGDFKGTLDEAQQNLRKYGCAEVVEWVPGFYSESLRGWNEKLALIWLDTDLRESTLDVLGPAFPMLDPHGVIFSDGLVATVDFVGDQLRPTDLCEGGGLYSYFSGHGINYKVKPAGPDGLALVIPYCEPGERILFNARKCDVLCYGA